VLVLGGIAVAERGRPRPAVNEQTQ
jgi:hypothetical protein